MSSVVYTLAQVAENNGQNGNRSWIVVKNNVYDITDFLNEHPGGSDILLEEAGKDATRAFNDVGHSSDAKNKMSKYKIGELAKDDSKKNTSETKIKNTDSERNHNRSCLSIITCGCLG